MDKESEKHSPRISALRMKVAINHFKWLLLGGDLHIPARHQETTTFNELGLRCKDVKISGKTWKSWFESPQVIPRIETIKTLDALASCAIRVVSRRDGEEKALPDGFYSQIVHGGLVREIRRASKSKHPLIALRDRAESYTPISPLHLHLDAIEVHAITEGHGDIPGETVKHVGAARLLNLLTERWGPRNGTVYAELSTDLRLEWDAASLEKRADIRKSLGRFKPDPFERILYGRAVPNWNITGIEADIPAHHIYKALFSLAADTKFLVADRLEAWSLDLATAAFAMHAFALSDQAVDELFPDELVFWCALDEIMFCNDIIDADNWDIAGAISKCRAEWSEASLEVFSRARNIYRDELHKLGMSVDEVTDVAMHAA